MKQKINKSKFYDPKDFQLKNYTHPDLFGEMVGYQVKKLDKKRGRAEAALRILDKHLSPAARVHGGVISAFFDFSFGAAVFTTLGSHDFCSTVELKVNYLRPLNLGDLLRCKTQVIYRGKRLAVCEGFIYRNRDPKPVAIATATFNIVSADQKGARGIPRTDNARSK